jgi:hypothetical protein
MTSLIAIVGKQTVQRISIRFPKREGQSRIRIRFQAVERGGTSVSSAIFTLIRSTARRAGDETHQVQPYGLSRVTARRTLFTFGHGAWLRFGRKRDLPPPSLVHGHAGGGRQMTAGIFDQTHPLLILARPLVKSPQKSSCGSAKVFHKHPLSFVGYALNVGERGNHVRHETCRARHKTRWEHHA